MKILIKILAILAFYINLNASNWIQVDLHKIELKQTVYAGIHCPDSLNCVAAANLGVDDYAIPSCRATTDGGKTWFTAFMDTAGSIINEKKDIIQAYKPPQIRDIAYPDTSLCVISCDSGVYWYSKDKLKTWKKNRFSTNLNLLNTKFLNAKIGALTTYKEIFLTKDGCNTWNKINFKDSVAYYNILDIDISDTNTIFLLTTVDTLMGPRQIFKSTDFGLKWEKLYQTFNYPFDIFAIDNDNIWYSGAGTREQNIIFNSTDGGYSWKKKLDKVTITKYGLGRIFFKENFGFALGTLAVFFYSSDYGETWIQDTTYHYPNLHTPCIGLAFLSKSKILVASNANGTIWMKDFSDITNVEEVQNNTDIQGVSIFPNPARECIEIRQPSEVLETSEGSEIRIYNVLGEWVLSTSVTKVDTSASKGQIRIDVSGLAPGLYFIQIGNYTEKFVVLR